VVVVVVRVGVVWVEEVVERVRLCLHLIKEEEAVILFGSEAVVWLVSCCGLRVVVQRRRTFNTSKSAEIDVLPILKVSFRLIQGHIVVFHILPDLFINDRGQESVEVVLLVLDFNFSG
jgi:hypothetical protein